MGGGALGLVGALRPFFPSILVSQSCKGDSDILLSLVWIPLQLVHLGSQM